MGLGEKLKDIYYGGEEKWYGFWDKVDAHIPVYKIIDPIDNVIPSYALFLIIIFLILLFACYSLVGGIGLGQSQATLKLSVVLDNSERTPVEGATVTLEGIGEFTTDAFGLIAPINVPYNSEIAITATKDTKIKKTVIVIDDFDKVVEIALPGPAGFLGTKSIIFKTESGEIATGEVTLAFSCSRSTAPPGNQTIYTGTTNVTYSEEECGTLTVSVTSPKYEATSFQMLTSDMSKTINLTSSQPKIKGKATVSLKLNGALITENITVQAFSTGNSYLPQDSKQVSNGQATFELLEGDYFFKVRQEQGYKAKESTRITVSQNSQASVDIAMEKSIIGIIEVRTREGSSVLSGVNLVLASKTSGGSLVEVFNKDSNDGGQATFELAESGNYYVSATKDGYCGVGKDVNIGDTIILTLKRADATCGQKVRVKVVDQDGKAVAFAKVALFASKVDEEYKLPYIEKITDFNGYAEWYPVRDSTAGETYRVFGFKAKYSGWSEARKVNVRTAGADFVVRIEIPMGTVKIKVSNVDSEPLQFSEVQLFDNYVPSGSATTPVTSKRLIENVDGTIEFNVKADKMVYAIVKKEGYETFTTIPKQVIGEGTIGFDITLLKPPAEQLVVRPLGFFKGESSVIQVEAGQEYMALFEITVPKNYDQVGFFARVGKANITKTELDKLFIKDVIAPGKKIITTGSAYNPPKGYDNIDSKYLNLEESKWANIVWGGGTFEKGKIIVGIKVKVKQIAQAEDRLDVGFRAWGAMSGGYERDPYDAEFGASQNQHNLKQELYASTKEEYITVGTETICDSPSQERSFCITATYTDPDNFTQSFTEAFDAKNNTPYNVSIKVMNNSLIGFDNARTMIDNPEQNLFFGKYSLMTPSYVQRDGNINGYKSEWINTFNYIRNSSISISSLNVVPQKVGAGTLGLKIRDGSSMIFEKPFTINVSASKKMKIQYMSGGKFVDQMDKIIAGRVQQITVKALDADTGLEVEGAAVKLYDRFGVLLISKVTNKLGSVTISIPASMPGEKLKLQIEKPEYETFVNEFSVAEDVVDVTPASLTFTVNPQSNPIDKKTVRIDNKTGLDLTIKSIAISGKLKGLLDEMQIENWFNNYVGLVIKSQDYEEIEFAVVSAKTIPTADDLDAVFQITVGSQGKEWVKEIPAKIRVGLGKDVDNPSCLQISKNDWTQVTRGNQIEIGLEVVNNCTVTTTAGTKPVALRNLGASINSPTGIAGTFNLQYRTAQVELGTAYSKSIKSTIDAGEKVPVTIKFTPAAGSAGVAVGTIVFEAQNSTDSKAQKLTAELKYNLDYENIQECLVIGADLVSIDQPGEGSFSINNTCKFKTDIQLDSGDLQGALSESIFSLNARESKDVKVKTSEGQLPGMYNVLILARQQGTTLEIVDNVKILAEEKDACIKLSRYEFDVFDSPYNNFDGSDMGYLRNECAERTLTVQVTGIIPYDMDKLLRSALIGGLVGGIAGYVKSGKWSNSKNPQVAANDVRTNLPDQSRRMQSGINNNQNSPQAQIQTQLPWYKRFWRWMTGYKEPATGTVRALPVEGSKFAPVDASCAVSGFKQKPDPLKIDTSSSDSANDQKTNASTSPLSVCAEACKAKYSAPGKDCKTSVSSCQLQCEKTVTEKANKFSELYSKVESDFKNYSERGAKTEKELAASRETFLNRLATDAVEDTTSVGKIDADTSKHFNSEVDKAAKAYNDDAEKYNGKVDELRKEVKELTNFDVMIDGQKLYSVASDKTPEEIVQKADLVVAEGYYVTIDEAKSKVSSASKISIGANEHKAGDILQDWEYLALQNAGYKKMSYTTDSASPWVATSTTEEWLNDATGERFIVSKTSPHKIISILQGSAENFGLPTFTPSIANFILASPDSVSGTTTVNTGTSGIFGGSGSGGMGRIMQIGLPYMAGSFANSGMGGALMGAATSFFMEWSQGKDTPVDYRATFTVPLIHIKKNGVTLSSPDGVVFDQAASNDVTYDIDRYAGTSVNDSYTSSSSKSSNTSTAYTGNYLYNSQAMTATVGTTELRELNFSNPAKKMTKSRYQPFVGVLTVNADENVYNKKYDYDTVKQNAIDRGEMCDDEDSGIFGGDCEGGNFLENLFKPNGSTETLAEIKYEDLNLSEVRKYVKKFHLLFDSYEFVDCGPNTYPCVAPIRASCDVDGKRGVTGPEGVPRIKLAWGWSDIDVQECDPEYNTGYNYCDTEQFTISTIKKLLALSKFLGPTNSLPNCPSGIDIVGTKTQALKPNALDVGITSIEVKPTLGGAILETVVETNNNLEMSARLHIAFKREDGTVVAGTCADQTKTFTSNTKFSCVVDSNVVGTGSFNVDATIQPTLCAGCENNDTANDTIQTRLIIGSTSTVQNCQSYSTTRDYFEKVLSANNKLTTSQGGYSGQTVLKYLSFKTNLVRDGFSSDFKADFDDFATNLAEASTDYKNSGLKELFLSDKFKVNWPTKPAAWDAGKYDARIVVKFKNNSWAWDSNNIESITISLDPQGDPEPYFTIYNMAFDGSLGKNSDNGRQGYGSGFVQKTEDIFQINNVDNLVVAQPTAASNALTTVNTSVIKGTQAFYLLNSTPTRGNVMSITRSGDVIDFTLTPSVAVPLILNISRKTSTDAYAFYSAEVNGQPQELGSSFISWTGIGQGCVDFKGVPMNAYYNTPDAKSSQQFTGFVGYGLSWPIADLSGTTSFYGSFFAPQDTVTQIVMSGVRDDGYFESTYAAGAAQKVLKVEPSTGYNVKSLKDVLDLVADSKVCVIGGDYYWNNIEITNTLKDTINAKENTCIASR